MPSEFEAYVANQQKIYGLIRDTAENARKNGLRPDPRVSGGYRGHTIVLKYPDSFAKRIADFSVKLGTHTSVIMKSKVETVHTTLAECQEEYGTPDKLSEEKIQQISKWIAEWGMFPQKRRAEMFSIRFQEILWNDSCVILAGHPENSEYLSFGDSLKKTPFATLFKLGWGSHITVARFEKHAGPDVARKVEEEILSTNFNELVIPVAIELASFTYNPGGGELLMTTRYCFNFAN